MKRSFKGLSLEIKKAKEEFVIIVMDRDEFDEYRASENDVEAKETALSNAKSWLWNMGSFNGQANEMMNKHNSEWRNFLGLTETSA